MSKKEKLHSPSTHRRRFRLVFLIILFLFLFLHVTGADAQAPEYVRQVVQKFTPPPSPIVQSNKKLPASIQQAIITASKQEIKKEQAAETLITGVKVENPTVFGEIVDLVSEVLSTTPADKAKAKIRRINRLINQLGAKQTTDQLIAVIKDIGQLTDQIAADPKLQTDRQILTLQIEQYNRIQLTLQKIEDSLPIESYLQVEDARQKYLVVTATNAVNAAPNLEAIHNIAVAEIAKIVGKDFSELKTIEIISDFESGIKPEARQKLAGLEKQLALEFEKRMLKLPVEVRNRKLQAYIRLSFGNPLRQAQAFDQIKNSLTDREMILGVDALKELALQKLENRVFEIKDQATLDQFLDQSFKGPADLKILAQMKLNILSGKDERRKKRIAELEANSQTKVEQTFSQEKNLSAFFAQDASVSADLLDVSLISQLSDTLNKSPKVSPEVKNAVKTIKQKTIQSFTSNIRKTGFVTKNKLAFNPVSAHADVRLLLPQPQTLLLLKAIKNDPATFDKAAITVAENAASNLITDRVLTEQSKENDQALYEKVQQITQEIFISQDNIISPETKKLPEEIQKEVQKLKQELPEKNVPQIETPADVKLPKIAKLPSDVEQAIITVAKDRIKEQEKQADVKLDLGVSSPSILPDSPLYPLVKIARIVALVIQTDPIAKAQELLKQDNEKTLEAAKLVEQSSSQKNITLAIQTLNSVNDDFNKLKEHTQEVKKLAETQTEKVDQLVDQIIKNGVARQTVFSAIEAKVHGDEFVAVEKIRSEVLKDGVDTLLQLTNNDVPKLTQKLETAVNNQTGSQLKDIKAVELLTEISRTQPEPVQEVLKIAEASISAGLEAKLLQIPKEQRTALVLSYAQSESGNPVRQFEAAEVLKDNFKNPETILLTEAIKDKAVENLKERVSEISDANSRAQFVDLVVGDKPQDLKIAVEIEARTEKGLPVAQNIAEIKAEVEQNIIDTYKDKPIELALVASVSGTPDVMDVKVAQELNNVLSRTPTVQPEVLAVAKESEQKITTSFIASVSAQTLNPTPEIIAKLVDLKNQLPDVQKAKIDVAIKTEVKLIEEHLTTQVTDATTFQAYTAQIKDDPVIAKIVEQVGGKEFTTAVEQKSQEIAVVAQKEEAKLQTTIEQVKQEVFSTKAVEQTLPPTIQQKVEEIKASEPAAQVPAVTTTSPAPTPSPAPSPAPAAPAPEPPAVPKPPEPAPVPTPSTPGL